MLTIEEIETKLLKLPEEIAASEQEEWQAARAAGEAEEGLKSREADLLTSGGIAGANAESRKADLYSQTRPQRLAFSEAQQDLDWRRIRTRELQAMHKSLVALCRIRGAE